MTREQVEEAVRKYGSQRKAAAALRVSRKTMRAALEGEGRDDARPAVVSAVAGSGFLLVGRTVLSQRPTDVWRGRFYALRRGVGYRVDALAKEWGTSPDTVRSKAHAHGTLRYVEDPERLGNYIACAVHPDTPKGK